MPLIDRKINMLCLFKKAAAPEKEALLEPSHWHNFIFVSSTHVSNAICPHQDNKSFHFEEAVISQRGPWP